MYEFFGRRDDRTHDALLKCLPTYIAESVWVNWKLVRDISSVDTISVSEVRTLVRVRSPPPKQYEVRRILGCRSLADGSKMFRVKWEPINGIKFPKEWLNERDLSCPALIKVFWDAVSSKRDKCMCCVFI